MKKFLYIFLFTTISNLTFSQSGWFWQNPLPQGNPLFGLKMFDANNAVCVDWDNILKTSMIINRIKAAPINAASYIGIDIISP